MTVKEDAVVTLCGTLEGHANWVTAIACPSVANPNVLVSASRDKTVMIWELTRSTERYGIAKRSLRGHNHFIQDMSLSADGQYALTASWDKTLRLWDLNAGKTTARFIGHTGDVMSVSLSPDNRQIVSGSRDKTIKIWNIKGDCKVNIKDAHSEWVSCTRFSPNQASPMMVSCGWDKVVKVWDMSRHTVAVEHLGHGGYVNTSQVSPDGSLCATGGKDGRVMLWDLSEHAALFQLDAGDEIHALAFSPTRYWLAAATTRGIKIWDLETRCIVDDLRPEFTQKTSQSTPSCISLCWSPDGATLFSGYTDSIIRVWQVSSA